MRITFSFKNGDNFTLSEEETKSVFKQFNYFKLLMYFSNSSSAINKSIRVLNRDIRPNELRSVSLLFESARK